MWIDVVDWNNSKFSCSFTSTDRSFFVSVCRLFLTIPVGVWLGRVPPTRRRCWTKIGDAHRWLWSSLRCSWARWLFFSICFTDKAQVGRSFPFSSFIPDVCLAAAAPPNSPACTWWSKNPCEVTCSHVFYSCLDLRRATRVGDRRTRQSLLRLDEIVVVGVAEKIQRSQHFNVIHQLNKLGQIAVLVLPFSFLSLLLTFFA